MILALCGTSDARELAVLIQSNSFRLLASVVTDQAANSLRKAEIPVRTGQLDRYGMVELVRQEQIRAIVDASHPFAEEAHRNAMAAAEENGIPYIRYERTSQEYGSDPKLTIVASYEEAAAEAKRRKGSVMLTTGSKTLHLFTRELLGDPGIRLAIRTLPRRDCIEKAEELGIEQRNVIALQGPFSRELNEALYRQYETTVMITKESGVPGSVDEKVDAAMQMGIHVIMISRPNIDFGTVFRNFEDVIRELNDTIHEEKE
ncbi:precorrin-6A reductase [Paenibacillus sp. HN-1]|uniref:precorrin-6A reductase n=1 Tax=Paenibacillus TaxID=44249 RepID=UPI001CA81605|nr:MULTISPECIES: precorrin-6A reductase [Paenibacillus]MBY9078141.1 precorrin-6A reductase [Paenibacillus sp. CGMCC 1.18879]MBY9083882.1 precorrin-6A reductase [Paenibacillus sinensis]